MTMPSFLRFSDPDREHDMEWARDAYSQRGREDRPFTVNNGYGEELFTVEDALGWAERRAQKVLGA